MKVYVIKSICQDYDMYLRSARNKSHWVGEMTRDVLRAAMWLDEDGAEKQKNYIDQDEGLYLVQEVEI